MPLLLVCGLPCSGKSSRVQELLSFLSSSRPGYRVQVVGEEGLGLPRECWFESSAREKEMRASIRGEVERLLTPDALVIVDSPCYVKGFRYELYCISKQTRTTSCLLLCATPLELTLKWNERREEFKYQEDTLREVSMRFESPNDANRWDRPLFRVDPDQSPPFEEITQLLLFGAAPKPNQSTQNLPLSAPSLLLDLEQVTSGLVADLMKAQTGGVVLNNFRLNPSSEAVTFCRSVSLPELRQVRRQFLSYCKLHPVSDTQLIASQFLQLLNSTFS